jgi:aryl-alcohol dehydrogenase-like predicted oxidoreductase
LTRELDVTTARGKSTTTEKFKDQPQTIDIIKRVKEVAQKKGVSMAQVAIAWTMEKGCAPIVGLSSVERINEAIKAVSVKLTEDEIKYLEELYKPVSAHI